MKEYYQNEPKFNGDYSRNNLSKIKDGSYLINLDEYESIGTHWMAFMLMQIIWHIFIVLELNIFLKKLKNS